MTSLVALEVAIGLAFIYFVFSLVISRINESVAARLEWRAEGLELGLRQLLTGNANPEERVSTDLQRLAELKHPLVSGLRPPQTFRKNKDRPPSYLPSRMFGLAVLDILAPARPDPIEQVEHTRPLRQLVEELASRQPPSATAAALRALFPAEADAVLSLEASRQFREVVENAVDLTLADENALQGLLLKLITAADAPMAQAAASLEHLPESHPAREPLLAFLHAASDDLGEFRISVEQWFDDAMDRISGWYKRRIQIVLVIYAAVLVLALNIDSVTLARVLWTDGLLRSAVLAAAEQQQDQDPDDMIDELEQLDALDLPLGWAGSAGDPRRQFPDSLGEAIAKMVGLALTIIALSAGAPFWFDALGRISQLRSSGPKPHPSEPKRAVSGTQPA